MNIIECSEVKEELQKDILALIEVFEKRTSLCVSDLFLTHMKEDWHGKANTVDVKVKVEL